MGVFVAHARYRALEYAREPFAIVPTLGFPVMITGFFILPNLPAEAGGRGLAIVLLLSFTMVAIFSFGAGTAEERRLPWDAFLRTLPLRPRTAISGAVAVGLAFAVVGALPAIVLLASQLEMTVALGQWPLLGAAVLLGTVAMSGIGLTVGYGLSPKAAIATANIVFLPMAFVGGLFLPPELLPNWASTIGWATPMRPWVELSFGIADGTGVAGWLWLVLAAWAVGLVAVTTWVYRRDQVRRYT